LKLGAEKLTTRGVANREEKCLGSLAEGLWGYEEKRGPGRS